MNVWQYPVPLLKWAWWLPLLFAGHQEAYDEHGKRQRLWNSGEAVNWVVHRVYSSSVNELSSAFYLVWQNRKNISITSLWECWPNDLLFHKTRYLQSYGPSLWSGNNTCRQFGINDDGKKKEIEKVKVHFFSFSLTHKHKRSLPFSLSLSQTHLYYH